MAVVVMHDDEALLDRKGRLVASRIRSQHRQCYSCHRLKHEDGTPHGRVWPDLSRAPYNYSHGPCTECLAKELARYRIAKKLADVLA